MSYIVGLGHTLWDMSDGVGLFHTLEYLGQRGVEVAKRDEVEANLCALTGAVDRPEADVVGLTIHDGLGELYARFAVLCGDCEGDVDDVGLCFAKCHDGHLSARDAQVINAGGGLIPNLDYVYIIPQKRKKNSLILFSQ